MRGQRGLSILSTGFPRRRGVVPRPAFITGRPHNPGYPDPCSAPGLPNRDPIAVGRRDLVYARGSSRRVLQDACEVGIVNVGAVATDNCGGAAANWWEITLRKGARMGETVLVIAAHPDDEVLGMGGTIAKHALHEGATVAVVCVTDGSSSQYPGNQALLEQKKEEAKEAAKLLGVDQYIHHDLPDMRLDTIPHVRVNALIEAAVDELRPSVVYTVHPDINIDHQAVFRSAMVATRPRTGSSVRAVLTYAPRSSVEWTPPFEATFTPTWYADISETLETKILAFSRYATETRPWPHPRSPDAIRAAAATWGSAVGCDAAEPFVLVRHVR
jgi:LmbE family N-acetylglucosaminyl deacetylase